MKIPNPKNTSEETIPELPDAELEVLACLWRQGKCTAREIREMMIGYRPMEHGSVATLLKRLESKSLVTKEKAPVGKAFLYQATHGPGPTYRSLLKNLSQRIFGGDRVALAASLFETRPPSAEELQQLQDLFEQLRQQKNRKGAEK